LAFRLLTWNAQSWYNLYGLNRSLLRSKRYLGRCAKYWVRLLIYSFYKCFQTVIIRNINILCPCYRTCNYFIFVYVQDICLFQSNTLMEYARHIQHNNFKRLSRVPFFFNLIWNLTLSSPLFDLYLLPVFGRIPSYYSIYTRLSEKKQPVFLLIAFAK